MCASHRIPRAPLVVLACLVSVVVGLACGAVGPPYAWAAPSASSANASPSPSPGSATPPPAAPARLTRALDGIDTWGMSAGSRDGWAVGDHVRVTRDGQAVADGVLIKVYDRAATLLMMKQTRKAQAGDGVAFARRRSPLPKDPASPAYGPRPSQPLTSGATGDRTGGAPTEWTWVGAIQGLLGSDWMEKRTRYAQVYARKGDLGYLGEVVDMLDPSYEVNRDFMGVTPLTTPMKFYFFPLAEPAHVQPMFQTRLASFTRAAGVALSGLDVVVVNLGNWRTGEHNAPWKVEKICRHEMNHLFMFRVRGLDRAGTWHWFGEALAHTIEDTVMPASAQLTLSELKTYMGGLSANEAGWRALIGDRDNDQLENYRDYRRLLMSVVFYLRDKFGVDVVRRLVVSAGQGRDIEDAFIEVTGKGTRDLEVDWRAYYGIR